MDEWHHPGPSSWGVCRSVTMQSVSIPVLQLGCLITQYSYHRQFVTLQRHAAHIISISPVVISVARGNIHHYRILVAVNCVTINLWLIYIRQLRELHFLVSWLWPQCQAPYYHYLRPGILPWPRNPRLVQYFLSRLVLAFRGKISKTRSVKFTSKITFHPTKHLIWLALRFPIVSVQSTVSRFHSLIWAPVMRLRPPWLMHHAEM